MKRFSVIFMVIFSVIYFNIGNSEKKKVNKDNPCVTECKVEFRRCLDSDKKLTKNERKAKIAECEKAEKDCKANCEKTNESN